MKKEIIQKMRQLMPEGKHIELHQFCKKGTIISHNQIGDGVVIADLGQKLMIHSQYYDCVITIYKQECFAGIIDESQHFSPMVTIFGSKTTDKNLPGANNLYQMSALIYRHYPFFIVDEVVNKNLIYGDMDTSYGYLNLDKQLSKDDTRADIVIQIAYKYRYGFIHIPLTKRYSHKKEVFAYIEDFLNSVQARKDFKEEAYTATLCDFGIHYMDNSWFVLMHEKNGHPVHVKVDWNTLRKMIASFNLNVTSLI